MCVFTIHVCVYAQVKGVMQDNVNKVLERGDHLGRLEGRAGETAVAHNICTSCLC